MKSSYLLAFISTSVMSLASYASTPASVNNGKQQSSPPKIENFVQTQSSYTSASWVEACGGTEAQVLDGCLTNAITVKHSPIGSLVNPMWQAVNTTPNSTPNSVYIRKFPPGYVFSANSQRALTYNATGIPSTSKAWCTSDPISESGVSLDCSINNDPNSSTGNNCIYNVAAYAEGILSGSVTTQTILQSTPYSGTALPLAIPIYAVCIGTNRTTGEPASLEGMSIY